MITTGSVPKSIQPGPVSAEQAPGTYVAKSQNTPGKEARQPKGNPAKGGRKGCNGAYGGCCE